MPSKGSRLTVVAVVALPPPMHGQAFVNRAVVDAIAVTATPLKVVNTSPGSLERKLSYHAKRISLVVFKAIPALLVASNGLLYTVVEPGSGICYNFLIVVVARMLKFRIVLHHHSAMYTKIYDRRFGWLCRLAGRETLHIALDEFMARDLRAKYSRDMRVVIAHNASHVARPVLSDRGPRELTCGFMSNLSREKGLDLFFAFLRSARASGLKLRAILAGPPASSEAEDMISDALREFAGILTVLGPVAGAEKEMFFRSIDVFLFPTRYKFEAQPLVILEALSYGVPVVTTEQGYCAELVDRAGASSSFHAFEVAAKSFVTRCNNEPSFLATKRVEARKRYEFLKAAAETQMSNLISLICSKEAVDREQ